MKVILISAAFFVLAVLFMGLSLHFAKYKKRKSACCGGAEHIKAGSCCGAHTECEQDR